MRDVNPYFAELQAINADVVAWYNGTAPAEGLERLMGHFSAQFSMILPNGEVLDLTTLRAIFAGQRGAREGFTITFDEMTMVAAYPGGAVVTYRESQRETGRNGAGAPVLRRSTALFECDAQHVVSLRHLHETLCAAGDAEDAAPRPFTTSAATPADDA